MDEETKVKIVKIKNEEQKIREIQAQRRQLIKEIDNNRKKEIQTLTKTTTDKIALVEAEILRIENTISTSCANPKCRNIYQCESGLKMMCTTCKRNFCFKCISHSYTSSIHPVGHDPGALVLAIIECFCCLIPSALFHRDRCAACVSKAWW